MLMPDQGLGPGWRRFTIPVDNESPRPAILVVADDGSQPIRPVGRVSPGSVPPFTSMDVTFDVPPGRSWMIIVNPAPENGGLISASDVPPGAVGALPLKIHIQSGPGTEGGSVEVPNLPGWFGN
jgi:hypothetical protein